ncbi:hypothetical protein K439DRAFT_1616199 [Ramaria rubella]|nr:hypothetical protein K439DRAFT_1616199 [Ramaria rubella]
MCFEDLFGYEHRESSANCVRMYNQALQVPNAHQANNRMVFLCIGQPKVPLPAFWQSSLSMSGGHVLDGFLLLDKAEHNETLVMPHDTASQKLHLEQNARMEGFSQEHYAHVCNLCCKMYKNDEGELVHEWLTGETGPVKLQGAASDGIMISHPCCAIHDCKIPLVNASWDVYCPAHLGYESKCAVTVSSHWALEVAYHKKGSAFFQLHDRIPGVWVGSPEKSITGGSRDGEYAMMVEAEDIAGANPVVLECDEKAVQGNHKLHAQFRQWRTHNEQLIIRPCGVIVSRTTFFGSEAISSVREFVLATFPTLESMPKAFFYDMNCGLLKHCRSIRCHWFDRTAVMVDVFHFTWKHKVSDSFCQENCNPVMFPELYVNSKWVFKSSVAEQTNV